MHTRLLILFAFVVLISCNESEQPVTKRSDYEKYLHIVSTDSMHSMQKINADMDFWGKRLKEDPEDVVAKSSLAGLYSAKFKIAGDINDILVSDSLYLIANSLLKTSSSSLFRSLAANCITRHNFLLAQLYIDSALSMGDDLYLSLLMQFDIAMELGKFDLAEQTLHRIGGKNGFDYLVREAKFLDHKGKLEEAIGKMEAALKKAIASNKESLVLWAKSNLGDMYGHGNRFKEAYQCYLEVLNIEPDYLYALKGIAWLAFSHDRNQQESKYILNYLSKLHPIPEYHLLLAEIAAYEKDAATEKRLLDQFVNEVSDSRYGDMYNKYVFYIMSDDRKDLNKALAIAETEITNRPTPQSYDLLAWAYYRMGKKDEALRVAKTYVENRNHEPDALYHLGVMYAHTGNIKKARYYLQEAKNSGFELGPVLTEKIQGEYTEMEK
jgi:tetratricopeptide (TPR) repeat protein